MPCLLTIHIITHLAVRRSFSCPRRPSTVWWSSRKRPSFECRETFADIYSSLILCVAWKLHRLDSLVISAAVYRCVSTQQQNVFSSSKQQLTSMLYIKGLHVRVLLQSLDRSWKHISYINVMLKVKVKAVCGSYSTAALRYIVLSPEWVPSFISRGAAHTKRRERHLLAKEATTPGI